MNIEKLIKALQMLEAKGFKDVKNMEATSNFSIRIEGSNYELLIPTSGIPTAMTLVTTTAEKFEAL